MKEKPKFNRRIFWDVDYDKIDFDEKYRFVIERVFERGDIEDIRTCNRYYGEEKISYALLNAKWLSKPTMYFASAVLKRKLDEFRCYILAQSNPNYWMY